MAMCFVQLNSVNQQLHKNIPVIFYQRFISGKADFFPIELMKVNWMLDVVIDVLFSSPST